MFSKPIYALSSPFRQKGDEIVILNPNLITAFGVDTQHKMFVNSVDGNRYYIPDNCDKTVIELCKFLYGGYEEFTYTQIRNEINKKLNEKE